MRLTTKQRRFAAELPTAPSATEAARRAGYSESCARAEASRNTTKHNVSAAIAEEQAKVEAKVNMTREQWIADLTRESNAGELGQPNSARVQALRTIGQGCGWLVDRVLISNEQAFDALVIAARPFIDPDRWDEFCEAIDATLRAYK